MDNIVMKICKIIVIICIVCIFIVSPLLDAYACSDEDIICSFVSYMNTNKYYDKYITIYEGIYTIDGIDMYVFTDVDIYLNYSTYAFYIDESNIVYYGGMDITYNCYDAVRFFYNLEYEINLPYTSMVVKGDINTVYYAGDVYKLNIYDFGDEMSSW